MCAARHAAEIEHEISNASALLTSGDEAATYDWYDRVVRLVAGIRGSEAVLVQLLNLGLDSADDPTPLIPTAISMLRQVLPLAREVPGDSVESDAIPGSVAGWGDSGPACPSAGAGVPGKPSPLPEALQIIQVAVTSPRGREEAMSALAALRDEMDRLDPRWEVVGPALIRMAEIGEEVFFPVVTWVVERRRTLGLA